YRLTDGVVKISGEATLDEVEDAIFENAIYRPSVIVANKMDLENAEANLKLLNAFVGGKLPVIAVSCEVGYGLEKLGETLFKMLDIIRVYTKEPDEREPSKKPFILRKGATVYDLAKNIHSDFSENFSYARVWARRLAFSPQKVGSTFVLEDGDIVEIHAR
ncbi:GTP-binding protein, partial [Candidatus Bathyarchaeota archaeon]